RLGQQFVIENRPGAGTNIATEAVVRAPADGYTLLLVTASNAFNATLYDKLNFNFIRDIAPVAGIMRVPSVMMVHPSVPAKTIPELIAYANANLGKINVASGSIGGPGHVAAELFKMMTGTDMPLVPYRGGGPALVDLLAGQVNAPRCFPRSARHRLSSEGAASWHSQTGSGGEAPGRAWRVFLRPLTDPLQSDILPACS